MEAMPPLDYPALARAADIDLLGRELRGEMAELRGDMVRLHGESQVSQASMRCTIILTIVGWPRESARERFTSDCHLITREVDDREVLLSSPPSTNQKIGNWRLSNMPSRWWLLVGNTDGGYWWWSGDTVLDIDMWRVAHPTEHPLNTCT